MSRIESMSHGGGEKNPATESEIRRAHDMVARTLAAAGRDLMYTPPEVLRGMMAAALAQVQGEGEGGQGQGQEEGEGEREVTLTIN